MAATSNKTPKQSDSSQPAEELNLETKTMAEAKPAAETKPEVLPEVMYVKHRSKGNFTGSTIEFRAGAPIYDKYQMHMLPKQGVELVTDREECDRW